MLPQPMPGDFMSNYSHQDQQQPIDDSDPDEIEDGVGESEPESEADEDLPLEMDDSRNANKVSCHTVALSQVHVTMVSEV